MNQKNYILTKEGAEKKLQRMALEIAEQLSDETEPLVIIGIRESGMIIASKIVELVKPLMLVSVNLISCSLNKKNPEEISYSEQVDFNGINVIVVDDVTSSGRTFLYAIKPLLQFYPKKIQTLALVERMHKSFPVAINYVGLSIATTLQEHILVEVEGEEVTGAYIT